jgi:hypothetical protein
MLALLPFDAVCECVGYSGTAFLKNVSNNQYGNTMSIEPAIEKPLAIFFAFTMFHFTAVHCN